MSPRLEIETAAASPDVTSEAARISVLPIPELARMAGRRNPSRTGMPALLDPVEDERWGQFVALTPEASIFHHPRWLALLQEQYRYRLMACYVSDRAGAVRAGLPLALISSPLTGRRLVALPFSDLCPPLSCDGAEPDLGAALDDLQAAFAVPLRVNGSVPGIGLPGQAYHHHLVALEPDVEAVQRRFTRRQVLQGVRRAGREGVVVEHRTDPASLAVFYGLHAATRRRQGIPTQPRRFIMGFADLFDRALGFVSLARLQARPIAAAVFLVFNGVLTYKYGASDPRFLDRRPNNLLFMDAIAWGCERGLHTFDLGRTDLGHESLRAFKLMWGAEERELRYTELGQKTSGRRSATPPAALRLLIRHAPPLLSRGLGEVLYRHAG
jgi:CelD/BcsL family acetyltransferase involved in cellulose biosynthesis